jgi:hypothetical protein
MTRVTESSTPPHRQNANKGTGGGVAPPERLETRAHRCGVVTETGEACRVWTLQAACLRHRRQLRTRAGE